MPEKKKKVKIDDITEKKVLSKKEQKNVTGGFATFTTKLGINGGDCEPTCKTARGTLAQWQGVDD